MRSEVIDRIFDARFPSRTRLFSRGAGHGEKPATKESGTTVMAFPYKDGVIMASDRKTSGGYFFIVSLNTVKIHGVGIHAGFGAAGSVSHIQMVHDELVLINSSFMNQTRYPLSIRGQAHYVASWLRDYSIYVSPWYLEAQSIIAGVDKKGVSIFEVEIDGALLRHPYVVVGSGTEQATAILDQSRRTILGKSLSESKALDLALRALWQSGYRDSGSSDLRVAIPTVAKITFKNGFEMLDRDAVSHAVDLIKKEKGVK